VAGGLLEKASGSGAARPSSALSMVRDLFFAVVIVLIVAVGLFFGVSGLSYITLVFAALLVSVAFVRRPAAPTDEKPDGRRPASVRPFPGSAAPRSGAGSPTSTRRYGAGPIQSNG